LLAGGFALGLGWRWAFFALSGLALLLVIALAVQAFPRSQHPAEHEHAGSRSGTAVTGRALLHGLRQALANASLLRWILLLQLSDLLLDIFFGYIPLYLADVVGLENAGVALWMGVLMFTGLVADLLVIPLLERFPGRRLVRVSAIAAALIYPTLLLIPSPAAAGLLVILARHPGLVPGAAGEAYAAPGSFWHGH
jgi:predicted MFS family arabinose efflux permease